MNRVDAGGATARPRAARRPLRLRRLIVIGAPLTLGALIVTPLVLLLANSFNVAPLDREAMLGLGNWIAAFEEPATVKALWYSIVLGLVRTVIAVPVALAIAWLIARSDMPGRSLVEVICWIGIFLPHLPLTFGWILMLDPGYGLVNQALDGLPLVDGPVFDIYSFWGITWVHLASTSIYYKVVLLLPAMRRMAAALEEAARVCGASPFVTSLRVTLPLLAPAVLGVAVLGFVRSLEVFEVELLLGPPADIWVYSTRIYNLVRDTPPQYGEATALGFVFVVVMVGLALLYQWYLRGKSFATVTGTGYTTTAVRLGRWRWPCAIACFGFLAVALAAPLVFLVLGSFMRRYGFFGIDTPYSLVHWNALFADPGFMLSVYNSLIISTAASVLVVAVYSLTAYSIVRGRSRVAQVTDVMMWVPWAVPGILMSLGLLWLFLGTPLRDVLYGSLFSIILAMALKDSPLATQFFKSAFLQIGTELEESARVTGASWLRVYWKVLLPLVSSTAATVGLLTFLSALRDISIPVLLYNAETRPLSILMLEYSFSGEMERGAAIGVLITLFVLALMLAVRRFGFSLSPDQGGR